MSSGYRLAPALAARLVGLVLVLGAVFVVGATLLTALFGWPVLVVLVVGLAALLATLSTLLATRFVPVLVVDDAGYRVRWVRGAGVKAAGWRDVADAVTGATAGVDCVQLRLHDGRSTSIPVAAVATDRDVLVTAVRDHLIRGQGLRGI